MLELVIEKDSRCAIDNRVTLKDHQKVFEVSNKENSLTTVQVKVDDLFYFKL